MQATITATMPSKPPSLRANVVANFLGRISGMLLGILFTPLYIHFLGIEAYGLIGFYLTLQGSMTFLEMGLSRACNRELARYSGQGEAGFHPMRVTLRTLDWVYWLVGLAIGGGITLLAPWIANSWLSSTAYSSEAMQKIVILMGWVIALRWPIGLYQGALMGMQRHVRMNLAQVGLSLLAGGGAVLVLWQFEASIQAFFQWQLVAVLTGALLFFTLSWQALPKAVQHANFSWAVLRHIYRFAAGVGLNAVIGTILSQADKLILSGLLPLKQFAYYALASLIAQTIAMAADAVSNAAFPRFSQMVGAKAPVEQISGLYHLTSQSVAVMIVPFALALAFFAEPALFVYSGDNEIARNTASILTILVIAKLLHASMIVPYALQLAYGWVRLSLYINIASVIWFIPALYLLSEQFGPEGAALAWLAVALGYVLIGIPLMHRTLLPDEALHWLRHSMIQPIVLVSVLLLLAKQIPLQGNRWLLGGELLAIGSAIILFAALTTQQVRNKILNVVKHKT